MKTVPQDFAMKDVVSIANKAGAAIMAELNAGIAVDRKGDASPVTAADRAADVIIKSGLRHLTPNIPIISEEDTAEEREAAERMMKANGGLRWVIDPLDGTKTAIDYAQGHNNYDQFGVHIGLVRGNTPIAGVAYFPAMEQGKGVAYFTDDGKAYKQTGENTPKQINVSKPPLKAGGLRAAVHFHEDRRPEMIAGRHYHAVPGVGGQRLCLVAEGAADVADMNDIPTTHRGQYAYKQWDLAAAHAILKAAGGELISAETQEPAMYDSPELKMDGACAGGREMLNLLQLATLPLQSSKAR